MFSGIIEQKTKILKINNWLFTVEKKFKEKLKIWESIAHDWACMTIDSFNENTYSFFAMQETFKKTNYWNKSPWDYFNFERSLSLWDRLHWHFVSGHVDTIWTVKSIEKMDDDSLIINIWFDKSFKKYMIPKWSITINWVSLTIVDLEENNFSVSLIPLTQRETNLGDLKLSDIVNLEFDMLWKYVLNLNK